MDYKAADKAIQAANRENMKAFGRLKTIAKWDEVSVIREVSAVYNYVIRRIKKRYLDIALIAYLAAMEEAGKKASPTQAAKVIDPDWITTMLEETDPTMLYKFLPEIERKKQRLIEALPVALDKSKEIDTALKQIARQIGQFAISVVDAATFEGYEDAGVKWVVWVSEHDARVCDICEDMDGNVYRIDKVPNKVHPNCRCRVRPFRP